MYDKNVAKWLARNAYKVDKETYRDYNMIYGRFDGHRIRYTLDGVFQVGAKDFDRWANSVVGQYYIDGNSNIAKQINLAMRDARINDTKDWEERSWDVAVKLSEIYS